jgi:hypothetical protein
MPSSHKPTTAPPPPPPPPPPKAPPPPLKAPLDLCAHIPAEVPSSCASKRRCCRPFQRRKNSPAHGLLTPTCSYRLPTYLPTLLQLPHHSTNQLGAPLPTEVPPRCAQVRCLYRLHRRKNSPLGAPTDPTEYPPPSQSPSNSHTPSPNQLGACSLLKCPPDASRCRSCC